MSDGSSNEAPDTEGAPESIGRFLGDPPGPQSNENPEVIRPNDPGAQATVDPFNLFSPPLAEPSIPPASTQFATARSNFGSNARSLAGIGTAAGLASVPFMIGDTNAGTCFALRGLVNANIGHPTLTCSRLNISENNTALPVDRVYTSYRHFHNATELQVFQVSESFNTDRLVLGFEKTFFGGLMSVETRIPVERRLTSDGIGIVDPSGSGFVDLVTADDYEIGLGNLSVITKGLLLNTSNLVWSGGLGVTLPTARDVRYQLATNVVTPNNLVPLLAAQTIATFDFQYENETVYLSPFLSWLWSPDQSRWFHQGFLQVEVAANPSTLTTTAAGTSLFFSNTAPPVFLGDNTFLSGAPANAAAPAEPVDSDVFAQTLMRLNLGVGYEFLRPRDGRRIRSARALFELHYTATLQRANQSLVPITNFVTVADPSLTPLLPFLIQDTNVGNAEPHTHLLNAAAGLSFDIGRFTITNGVAAPLREAPDRGFDFEYNLQVQMLL
ncbi:MAG: hypothetical protein AAGD07_08110 [Planctomycetota bacterium]